MVIIRLGNILLYAADDDLLCEAGRPDNFDEWMQSEREFRLCRSLRVALRETQTLAGKLTGAVSTKDWDALLQQRQSILAIEGEMVLFIGQQFHRSTDDVGNANLDVQKTSAIRDALAAFRTALIPERKELIKQEFELYTLV